MIADDIKQRAALRNYTVVLPDSQDARMQQAAEQLNKLGIAHPLLVNSNTPCDVAGLVAHLMKVRAHKGITEQQALELANLPLFRAAWMVATTPNTVGVAGAVSTTADVLRAGLWTIGLAPETSVVSSFFLMAHPNGHVLTFADCAVIPDPTAEQLTDIAWSAAVNHRLLTNCEPRLAFLSYSTKGSASHPNVDKVQNAFRLFTSEHAEVAADGELQVDAALIPSVAHRKAPLSAVAGMANVLIFPDLQSGNIGYKLTERLGGYNAFGPIVQGLRKPFVDLSRGCSVEDIVTTAAIAVLLDNH